MKTGLLHLNVKKDKISDFKQVWNGMLVDLRKEKGFQSAFLFLNPDTGKAISLGFYDSPENAKAFESSDTYKNFLTRIQGFVDGTPHREICDVSGDLDLISGAKKAA